VVYWYVYNHIRHSLTTHFTHIVNSHTHNTHSPVHQCRLLCMIEGLNLTSDLNVRYTVFAKIKELLCYYSLSQLMVIVCCLCTSVLHLCITFRFSLLSAGWWQSVRKGKGCCCHSGKDCSDHHRTANVTVNKWTCHSFYNSVSFATYMHDIAGVDTAVSRHLRYRSAV